jgi:hypothetical protein
MCFSIIWELISREEIEGRETHFKSKIFHQRFSANAIWRPFNTRLQLFWSAHLKKNEHFEAKYAFYFTLRQWIDPNAQQSSKYPPGLLHILRQGKASRGSLCDTSLCAGDQVAGNSYSLPQCHSLWQSQHPVVGHSQGRIGRSPCPQGAPNLQRGQVCVHAMTQQSVINSSDTWDNHIKTENPGRLPIRRSIWIGSLGEGSVRRSVCAEIGTSKSRV